MYGVEVLDSLLLRRTSCSLSESNNSHSFYYLCIAEPNIFSRTELVRVRVNPSPLALVSVPEEAEPSACPSVQNGADPPAPLGLHLPQTFHPEPAF